MDREITVAQGGRAYARGLGAFAAGGCGRRCGGPPGFGLLAATALLWPRLGSTTEPAPRRAGGVSLALFYHQLGQLRQRIEADPATRLNIEEVANWLRRAEWFWEKTGELCRTGGGAADRGSSFERRGPI